MMLTEGVRNYGIDPQTLSLLNVSDSGGSIEDKIGCEVIEYSVANLSFSCSIAIPTPIEWQRYRELYGSSFHDNAQRIWLQKQVDLHRLITGNDMRPSKWSKRIRNDNEMREVIKTLRKQVDAHVIGQVVPIPSIDPKTLKIDEGRFHFLVNISSPI